MPVYGYVRYSEVDKVKGVNRQRAVVTKFFTKILEPQGLTFDGFYKDAGKDARRILTDREMGSRLNMRVRKGDTVIFASAERCFPSLRDLINVAQSWTARGVRVVVIDFGLDTSTKEGKETIAHFDHFERWSKKFTSASGSEQIVANRPRTFGKFYCQGVPPYGWKRVKLPDNTIDLVPFEEEREVFLKIKEIYDRVQTYLGTEAEAMRMGLRSVRGKRRFRRKQIQSLLSRGHEILSDKPPKPVWSQFKKSLSQEERMKFLKELGFQRLDHHKDKSLRKGEENGAAEKDRRADQQDGDRDPEAGQDATGDHAIPDRPKD